MLREDANMGVAVIQILLRSGRAFLPVGGIFEFLLLASCSLLRAGTTPCFLPDYRGEGEAGGGEESI